MKTFCPTIEAVLKGARFVCSAAICISLKPSQTNLQAHLWQAQALLPWPARTQPLASPQVLLLLLYPLLRVPVLIFLGQLHLQRELLLLQVPKGCPDAQRCQAAQMADFQGMALLDLAAQQLYWQPLLQPQPDWPTCMHNPPLHSIAMRTPGPILQKISQHA